MLTLITPTGERPEAFKLCKRMMARQNYSGPVRWIIVDDGEIELDAAFKKDGWSVEVLRPLPRWKPGDNTQGRNLNLALDACAPNDVIAIVEDDDWYHADWLAQVMREIESVELIGEANAIYYNVRVRKWAELRNQDHASLRCSAMRGAAIDTFREVLKTPYRYYDMRLWQRHPSRRVFHSRLTVGMKGLPGRPGIALGHDGFKGHNDRDTAYLQSLIGDDAGWYAPFFEESGMAEVKYYAIRAFNYGRQMLKPGDEFAPKKRIDAELHLHAKKIECRTAIAPIVEKPRKMQIERQEAKMAEVVIEKTDAPTELPEETKPADEKKRKKLSIGI